MPSSKHGKSPRQSAGNTASLCRELAEPLARQLGLSIWDVRYVKEGATFILRVVIDKEGDVTIDDCVDMTHLLSPALDKADPIDGPYCLEVTSPGIERELVRPEHFEAYEGWPVAVKLYRPLEGVREFAGLLLPREEEARVAIQTEEGDILRFDQKDVAMVHVIDDMDLLEDVDDNEPEDG